MSKEEAHRKMKIALCTDSFLPVVDGVGRVAEHYARELCARGNECCVITPFRRCGYRGSMPFEIIDFTSVPVPTAKQYSAGIATLDAHYMERIREEDFDVIHAHSPGASGIEAMRLAARLGRPLIGTFHSKYYDDLRRYTKSEVISLLGVRFVVNFYERCDEVWTVSNHAAETLRSYGYRGDISVVRNGTDTVEPDPAWERAARERFELPDDVPVMLFTGQLDRKKNVFALAEAAALLKLRGRDFRIVFAGQGQDEETLRLTAESLGIGSRTVFTGHIYDHDLLSGLYMAASLFVFPSEYDTAGLVVSEAASMGTPSLVVRGSAPSEFIRAGESGLVCENTPEAICSAMERFLFKMSDEERREMSACARREIPLPWDTVFDDVEQRYRRLAEGFRPSAPRRLSARK